MVLLGHSMGGLLSHMMAVSSGDELWRLYSDRPFDSRSSAPPEVLEELQRYLFFEPLPFVEPGRLPGARRIAARTCRGASWAGSARA